MNIKVRYIVRLFVHSIRNKARYSYESQTLLTFRKCGSQNKNEDW